MFRMAFAGAALLLAEMALPGGAQAASESVVYSFCGQTNCTDGALPVAALVADSSGNLYGTTCAGGANDDGEVFELTPSGALTVLHSFSGTDGVCPGAGVIMDSSGNLYGTASQGGNTGGGCGDAGCGTVFKLAPGGTLTVLYAFSSNDGSTPYAALLMDKNGNLYGTTVTGGSGDCSCGTVFELPASGGEQVLYSFCSQENCMDGISPWASVIMDGSGNLYGTATYGGEATGQCDLGCGTIFEITAAGKEKDIYAFQDLNDGAYPLGGLTFGRGSELFGTAEGGGSHNDGTVFKVRRNRVDPQYQFRGKGDAQLPDAGLISDGKGGGFYGTTCAGGEKHKGAVFSISASKKETVVYSFEGKNDGVCPAASLLNVSGTLYGTTTFGGGTGCTQNEGCGTVFAVKP
ncbi:MAG TPA: choice-of-anchor tandem repeat GloVer-containing protein [Rhizomicrobium sp.]|nr:choice-of-anchor tandem repeat GloVer-containing protein [Rhizomicrobium sp.]